MYLIHYRHDTPFGRTFTTHTYKESAPLIQRCTILDNVKVPVYTRELQKYHNSKSSTRHYNSIFTRYNGTLVVLGKCNDSIMWNSWRIAESPRSVHVLHLEFLQFYFFRSFPNVSIRHLGSGSDCYEVTNFMYLSFILTKQELPQIKVS